MRVCFGEFDQNKVVARDCSTHAAQCFNYNECVVASEEARRNHENNEYYTPLREVLDMAYTQAAEGKGKERHANGKPFTRQPIMEIGRMTGTGGPLFQAMKKCQEAERLPTVERKVAELLGAINYIAAAVILLREAK